MKCIASRDRAQPGPCRPGDGCALLVLPAPPSVDVRCGGAHLCRSIGHSEISEIDRDRLRAHALAHDNVVVEQLAEELSELLRLQEGERAGVREGR